MNTSCAARHALSLGLHRKASYAGLTAEDANNRRRLFWSIYTHDKSVSLTLGQSPTIQDDDIDVDMFDASPDPRFAPWDHANQAFYNMAKIEGMIYTRLYTAAALRKTNEERLAIAAELEQSLKNWWQQYMPVSWYSARLNCLLTKCLTVRSTGLLWTGILQNYIHCAYQGCVVLLDIHYPSRHLCDQRLPRHYHACMLSSSLPEY